MYILASNKNTAQNKLKSKKQPKRNKENSLLAFG
jgi:hypothetical protein